MTVAEAVTSARRRRQIVLGVLATTSHRRQERHRITAVDETIFSICHFSPAEREAFLHAYRRAHPGRLEIVDQDRPMRRVVIEIPDFGSAAKNRAADEMLADIARRLAKFHDVGN
jgi:hypothetical protein